MLNIKIERTTKHSKRIRGYVVGAPLCSPSVIVSRSKGDIKLFDIQCQPVWFVQEIL